MILSDESSLRVRIVRNGHVHLAFVSELQRASGADDERVQQNSGLTLKGDPDQLQETGALETRRCADGDRALASATCHENKREEERSLHPTKIQALLVA